MRRVEEGLFANSPERKRNGGEDGRRFGWWENGIYLAVRLFEVSTGIACSFVTACSVEVERFEMIIIFHSTI